MQVFIRIFKPSNLAFCNRRQKITQEINFLLIGEDKQTLACGKYHHNTPKQQLSQMERNR